MERDETAALCHECGGWFESVGSHAHLAHGLRAAEYRRRHGIPRTVPLVSLALSRAFSERAQGRVGSAAWGRLEAKRDPLAASQARDAGAFRSAAMSRDGDQTERLPRRAPAEKSCAICGATYTGRDKTCGSDDCQRALYAERQRAVWKRTKRVITDAERAEIVAASGQGLAEVVRRLQGEGVSSADIGRVLGRSSAWMTAHFPRVKNVRDLPRFDLRPAR